VDGSEGDARDRQATRGALSPAGRGAPAGSSGASPEGRTPDKRRGLARGNIPGDPAAEPVLLRTSGREKGGTLYLAREILDAALGKAHLPIGTPARDLIVMRKVLGGRRHIAQVLLEIRVRKEAGT